MKIIATCLITVLAVSFAAPTPANDVREISWEDLVPTATRFEDPFAALSEEQLMNLSLVARMRMLLADKPESVSAPMIGDMEEAQEALIATGVDIDGLLAQRDEIRRLRQQAAEGLVGELDGASIRMPGFALPLDYDGRAATQFLLVPYWGACIHTPPPPLNQIVFVRIAGEGRELDAYEPVWVAGEMKAETGNRNLFYRDGAADIATGYTLVAERIDPYEQ